MNNLVPAASTSFADLQMIPIQREIPRTTALEEILAAVYRQRYLIIASVGICVLLAAIVSLITPRQYTATASVQLDQQTPQVMGDNNNSSLIPEPSIQDADRFLQTQLDRLRSRSIAERVVDDLHLVKSPAAIKALAIEPSDPATTRELVVETLQANMQAQLGLNTRLAQISYTSRDPKVSSDIANGFADALAESNLDSKQQISDKAKQYLLQQLAQAKGRLETSEKEQLAYARKEDITSPVVTATGNNNDTPGSLKSQQLGLMNDSLAQATARRIDAQQRWAQVQETPPLQIPEVESNSAIQDLVSQRAQLEATLEQDKARYTDQYPEVKETAAKIAELDGQIANFATSIKSSFYGQYLAAAQQERQMQQSVSSLRGQAMSEKERSVGYNSLSREVETNKAFYDGLLQRYKEVATASGAAAANIIPVDRAWPPLVPDSAHWARNLALGSIAGMIIALFAGAIRERMHNVVRSSDDFERALNMPALGVVPKIAGPDEAETALDDTGSAQTEAYHSIAVALQDAASGTLPKTLLVTSSTASEGKSTSAIGIARSLSAMGKRVLLIDGDLRRPSATKVLGNANRPEGEAKPGLTDVLNGSAAADNSVETIDDRGFSIVRAGDRNGNPVGLLAAERIKGVFDRLAADHDIVIVDGPPVMGLADAVLLARSVDSVVVVVEANRTHLSEVDVAISRLPQSNIIGGIITKFDARRAGVRYGSYNYYRYENRE